MKKAVRSYSFLAALLLLVLSPGLVIGQDIQFTATSKPVVAVGETFTLVYRINGQGSGFRPPAISNFEILSGPNTSTSSSIQSMNGRTSVSITYSFTYILQATREGTFEIPAASVTVDKKNYTSNTVTVKVVRNGSAASQQGAPSKGGQQNVQTSSNDVFLKAFADNDNPYQGQEVVATYKLYWKVNISLRAYENPAFTGFWSQDLNKSRQNVPQYKQVIDGEQYNVAEIGKIALFPLKSGRFVIDPAKADVIAQVRQQRTKTGDPFFDDFFNDPFFSSTVSNVERSIRSNPLVINARPLPTERRPADFSGAVGSFRLESKIDKATVNANEPVSLKYTISGQGNIQLIDKLNVIFPPDFETYDPKTVSDVNTTTSGVSGSQTFEYLVIPRKPGKFTIKPVTFSYFDLSRKQYVTLTSQEYTIEVGKGTGSQSSVAYTGSGREDIQYIGSDIRYIITEPFTLHRAGSFFFGSTLFFLLILVPLLAFILLLIFWKKEEARRSDLQLMKNRKATQVARKKLRKAEEFMKAGNQDAFYEEISRALWGYLSDKFGIPPADLSMDTVQATLTDKGVGVEIVTEFIAVLNDTEYARFAPGDKALKMEEIYQKGMGIITRIEKELR